VVAYSHMAALQHLPHLSREKFFGKRQQLRCWGPVNPVG
jgi:hypothetical protein